MKDSKKNFNVMMLLMAAAFIAGCSGISAPKGMESTAAMQESAKMSDTLVYVNPQIEQTKYTKFILEPVEIYEGEDSDFGKIDMQDRQMMADFIRDEFIKAFEGSNFPIVTEPGKEVLRVKFTLIGLTRSVPVAQGINYVAWPVGTGIQVAKGALDKSGTFMGNAVFAAEFYDSLSDDVAAALITKQSANALDFEAAFSGKYGAAKIGITDFMKTMRKRADESHGFNAK
jgi:hypothetical protein